MPLHRTKIPYCTHVANWQYGCSHISAGCENCWAEVMSKRLAAMRLGFYPKVIGKDGRWVKLLYFDTNEFDATWTAISRLRPPKESRHVIFLGDMTDLFHEDTGFLDSGWRRSLAANLQANPQHVFLLFTKRPGMLLAWQQGYLPGGLPPNVVAVASVSSQYDADIMLPNLVRVKGGRIGVSCEPLLGPVDLKAYVEEHPAWVDAEPWRSEPARRKLDWIVVGGESGPKARPMHPQWARDLRDFALAHSIPFWFKQWGAWHPVEWSADVDLQNMRVSCGIEGPPAWRKLYLCRPDDAQPNEAISMQMMARMAPGDFGTRECDRMMLGRLDGQEWRTFP